MIYVNKRVLGSHTTGVQRYLGSILDRVTIEDISTIGPSKYLSGFKGHLWEQCYLPLKLSTSTRHVLWSPSNTGPIFCPCNQVVTIHDFATLDYPEWTSKSFNLLYSALLPRLVASVDKIIAISEYTKSRILSHCDIEENKITVIKNGVDERFFIPTNKENFRALCNKYKIPSSRYILSVSSIEPRKNIATLLQAWKKIVNKLDDDVFLVLVGKRNTKIFSDAGLAEIPPRVHFTGFVDDCDLVDIYQNAFLFIYISLYEGFGLPPLEAMAAGVPVITSNTTAIPEVVGDKAISVNPLSISDVAENILLLADSESLRHQLGVDGIMHAKQFSWHDTADKTIKLLKSME